MLRLRVKVRREPLSLGGLAAAREHVRRDVAAVDIEAVAEVREQEPARAAAEIERRLARLDVAPEVVDLGAVGVELGPVVGHDAVVPGRNGHARSLLGT